MVNCAGEQSFSRAVNQSYIPWHCFNWWHFLETWDINSDWRNIVFIHDAARARQFLNRPVSPLIVLVLVYQWVIQLLCATLAAHLCLPLTFTFIISITHLVFHHTTKKDCTGSGLGGNNMRISMTTVLCHVVCAIRDKKMILLLGCFLRCQLRG